MDLDMSSMNNSGTVVNIIVVLGDPDDKATIQLLGRLVEQATEIAAHPIMFREF